jgi:hypothetical protein
MEIFAKIPLSQLNLTDVDVDESSLPFVACGLNVEEEAGTAPQSDLADVDEECLPSVGGAVLTTQQSGQVADMIAEAAKKQMSRPQQVKQVTSGTFLGFGGSLIGGLIIDVSTKDKLKKK